jgi:cytochrome b561
MADNASTTTYTAAARVFHWLTAAMVLALIPIGLVMNHIENEALAGFLYDTHRSLGAVLIPVVALRLVWRLTHTPPPLPADLPLLQKFAASATHFALYVLLIVQPMLGWIATSAYRAPITVFWLFPLPPIWPENRALSEQLFRVHWLVGLAMALLIGMHIAAALYHQFIRRDGLLLRMWNTRTAQ